MALNASKAPKSSGGGNKADPMEAGNYLGRVVQVLDLGLQKQRPYQGQEKPPVQELMLTYELGTEFLKDEEGNDREDKPRWISETFPLHHIDVDLAKSTKRIKTLDPANDLAGDFSQLINFPCTITIVNNVDKKDNTKIYNNVGNVTPPMKGFPVPELVNPPKVFDLDEPDMEIFGSLPDWLQEKISGNLNFNGSALQAAITGNAEAPAAEAPAQEEKKGEENPY